MKRTFGLLVLLAACTSSTTPSTTLGTYFLASIDGKPLPATPQEYPAGSVVQNGSLVFDPERRPHEDSGTVLYLLGVQHNGGTTELQRVTLWYSKTDNLVSINTCPPGALCLVAEDLSGKLEGTTLTLTHTIAGVARSVYRFERQMID